MVGDTTDSVWGVMDIYPQTDFPDFRKKAVIRSDYGDILIIPREGGSLTRLYVELPEGTKAKEVTIEDLQATARKVFQPYKMEVAEVYWWSAFVIGQRLCDHFSKDDRVFLTGDACHTHSPKAGQGMNTSLQDGYNIGWKLASALKKQVHPDILKSYDLERGMTAADLINFDRHFAAAFSSKAPKDNENATKFSDLFVQVGKYTAGLSVHYKDSSITWSDQSTQELAKNITVGMRFPTAQVVRFCDARAMQLVKALTSDGRWRIVVFAGDSSDMSTWTQLSKVCFQNSKLNSLKLLVYPI
jgi:phenol 2-monooxygenase